MDSPGIVRLAHGNQILAVVITRSEEARLFITPEQRVFLTLLVVHSPYDDLLVRVAPPRELNLAAGIGRRSDFFHHVQRHRGEERGIDPIVNKWGPQGLPDTASR